MAVDNVDYAASQLRDADQAGCAGVTAGIGAAETRSEILSVLHRYRRFVGDLPLPRPAAVDMKQARKDAGRDNLALNDVEYRSDAGGFLAASNT